LEAFPQQLLVHQRPGDALLGRRPAPPLLQYLVDPLAYLLQHRLRALV
jgi:hypothetical protein